MVDGQGVEGGLGGVDGGLQWQPDDVLGCQEEEGVCVLGMRYCEARDVA